eukprot:SAG11_NODE_30291_length_302_cov_0.837438_1_plen_63_part_01
MLRLGCTESATAQLALAREQRLHSAGESEISLAEANEVEAVRVEVETKAMVDALTSWIARGHA